MSNAAFPSSLHPSIGIYAPTRERATRGADIKRIALFLTFFGAAFAARSTPSMAQTVLTIPGGASGADVFCLQSGNLANNVFAGTFLQTGKGAWEHRSEAGAFKLEEKSRDDLMVELFDSSRSASVQIDFVTKTIREKPSGEGAWTDGYGILNATNEEKSGDCVSAAALNPEAAEAAEASDDESSKGSDAKADKPSKGKKDAQSTSKKRKQASNKPSKRTRAGGRKNRVPDSRLALVAEVSA